MLRIMILGAGMLAAAASMAQPAVTASNSAAEAAAPIKKSAPDSALPARVQKLSLRSSSVAVVDQDTDSPVYEKNSDKVAPIASLTKLMTAMVVLDAKLPLDEILPVDSEDMDQVKGTHSRLRFGVQLSRADLLHLALMASENRAAAALGRAYPGGLSAFVTAMNNKAAAIGMNQTHFVDSTGLRSENVSTAGDLVKMVRAAYGYDLIREYTTSSSYTVEPVGMRRPLEYRNSNRLVSNPDWDIGLSKTGFIAEAGRCLVMQAKISSKPLIIVLLDSAGYLTRIADANRIKKWILSNSHQIFAAPQG